MFIKHLLSRKFIIILSAILFALCIIAISIILCNDAEDISKIVSSDSFISNIDEVSEPSIVSDTISTVSEEQQENPADYYSDGMTKLDLASLIGENRELNNNVPISENTIAIISILNLGDKSTDLKIDLIDLSTKKLVCDSYYLDEIDKQGLIYSNNINGYYFDGKTISFYIIARKFEKSQPLNLLVKVDLNSKKFLGYSFAAVETNDFDYSFSSESCQYNAFYVDDDLYIRDNVSGAEKLVYDSIFVDDFVLDERDVKFTSGAFFVGDLLYFNEYNHDKCLGSVSYNPSTNEMLQYYNGIHITDYINGYFYGKTSPLDDDYYFGSFHIDNPTDIDKLIDEKDDLYISQLLFSTSGKYLIKITSNESKRILNTDYIISTVTLYDSSSFEIIKTYTFNSVESFITRGIIVGDYIYMLVNSTYNDAYIIKID